MSTKSKTLVLALALVVCAGLLGFSAPALAYSPTLSISGSEMTINGAYPNSSIQLNYTVSGSSLPTTVTNIGNTDYSGNFSTDLSSYGIPGGALVYVTVGGQQSNSVTMGSNTCGSYGCNNCGYYGCGGGTLSLSQTSLTLSNGQTSSVTIYGGGSYYISSNSNSSVATASISGNQVNVYGNSSYGSTTISICQSGYGSGYNNGCVSLYVTVNIGSCGYYGCGTGTLSLSQTSLSLTAGQSSTVTAYTSNGGTIYISSNSNSSVASASVSGNSIYVYGLASGSTTISVCQNSYSQCASLYVSVNGNSGGNGSVWFSPSNPSMYTGQSLAVSISSSSYNGAYPYNSSAYYIASNSNSNVVTATVSGTVLNLYANSTGSDNINVCLSSLSFCGTLYVTVNGGNGYGNGLTLSETSLSVNSGQSGTVTIYGSGSYYISSNSNSSIASASISGSQITVYGMTSGSDTISVCQSGYGNGCASLYVTVTGNNCGYYGSNCGSSTITFSPQNPNLTLGQSMTVSIYSNNGYYSNYYISSNSNSGIVSASITGSSLYLYGSSNGNDTLTICQNSYSACGTLYVTVGGGGYYGNSLSLSQTSLTLYSGQSSSVSIYGNNGYSNSYYISSNSNSYVASASVSGNILNVYGSQNGSTTIIVCQNSYSGCADLYVNVGNSAYPSSSIVLSQYNLSLNIGQSGTVNVSGNGGYGYYIGQNSNPGTVTATFNGSVLSLYGLQNGTSTLQICQNGANSCQNLFVTVGGYAYNNNGNGNGGSGLQYPGGNSNVLGASTYANGELISEGSTVYIVYKNTQTPFSNASAFTGLGFKFSNVVPVTSSALPNSGYTVTTASGRHPYGSWIKNGTTVYFVGESGLIPIPNWNTFLNNGGQGAWIVNANYYDMGLPLLSPMSYGDSRLQ